MWRCCAGASPLTFHLRVSAPASPASAGADAGLSALRSSTERRAGIAGSSPGHRVSHERSARRGQGGGKRRAVRDTSAGRLAGADRRPLIADRSGAALSAAPASPAAAPDIESSMSRTVRVLSVAKATWRVALPRGPSSRVRLGERPSYESEVGRHRNTLSARATSLTEREAALAAGTASAVLEEDVGELPPLRT